MLVAVVNESTVVSPTDAQTMVAAVAKQLRYHLCPAWRLHTPPVILYPNEAAVPAGADLIAILDDADQAGALGWHSESPQGSPYGRVFAKTSTDAGVAVSTVLSHECMELAVDPGCQLWADKGDGTLIAVEVGDPVEGDSYMVKVRGGPDIAVSNFVTPAWIDPQGQADFDWLGKVSAPFEMSAGGYLITQTNGQVSQVFGAQRNPVLAAMKDWPASRTARRMASAQAGS